MVLAPACASTPSAAPELPPLEAKLRRIEVAESSFSSMRLKLLLSVDNPGSAARTLSGGEFSVTVVGPGERPDARADEGDAPMPGGGSEPPPAEAREDEALASSDEAVIAALAEGRWAGAPAAGTLPAGQRAEVPVWVTLELPDDPALLARLLSWRTMTLSVEGTLAVDGVEEPVRGQREVATPRLPRAQLREAQLASIDRGQKGVAFFALGIDNPNAFELPIEGLSWSVEVGGKSLWQTPDGIAEKIPASSVANFEESIELSTDTYGKELKQLLRQTLVPYVVAGHFEVRGVRQHFRFAGEMEFAR